ncbi:MAG TPA: acyl-CoA dehydrogenase [Burkholderiales bacterium]|nr:acyl-CoA dehydrogenase [Burkholderiales bacterium]
MSTYRAPLKDIQFALRELAGLEEILALPGAEEINGELVDAVLAQAGKFAQEVLHPLNHSGDREGARLQDGQVHAPAGFAAAYAQFVAAGWNGLTGDTRYGGQGLPHVIGSAVQEIWNSANMAFCLAPMLTAGVLEAFGHHASEEQRALFLPRLTSGEWTGTMNLTEPQAGSDLSAVNTRATPEGKHYRLRGTKIFITWGEHDMSENIVHLVLARTPDAPEGVKGISLFIVPKFVVNPDGTCGERNDVKCVSIEHKMGIHASPTCVLSYGEEKGAIGYLVGEENRGLSYMFTMMNHARLGVGIEGVGIAERAYQHALEYARTRVQGRAIDQASGDRVTIIHHPDVRRMLLTMKAQIEAMRGLAYIASAALDRAARHPDSAEQRRNQRLVDLLTPVVKGWCTEQAIEIASMGVQVHGGMGYVEETGAAQFLRDARITTIYEGTTGIQANDLVGRKIALDRGTAALELIEEMRRIDTAFANLGADFDAARSHYAQAVNSFEQATRWLIEACASKPQEAAAVAVPYLKLFGAVAGGWVMARAALMAHEKRSEPQSDADFLEVKLATARFYFEHILPQASGYADTVTSGAASVMALAADKF